MRASYEDNASYEEMLSLQDYQHSFFAKQAKLCSATLGKYIYQLAILRGIQWGIWHDRHPRSKTILWLGKDVKNLAKITCEQVHQNIVLCGEKISWVASYDEFILTRGHHSNNSSGTLHDV